ncbi:MAG TPA: PspC domain-containing protein [Candidatus Saccharimonas sp.]|nr:PspC domain-containing protein [Candidatus Saccharimonas sp.]
MKEITRIHLAALPYNIEVAAKKELEKYLHAIESSLAADGDAMREIESRITEILIEHGVSGERVITASDVDSVREQLGDPKDFMSDIVIGEIAQQTNTERRLMRDTSRVILGGVCSGIGAYFHVDVVLVRLVMIVLGFVTSGAAFIAYLVAWIVIPPARTAAERLQMAGRPVTLEALQAESAVIAVQQQDHRVVLTILRYLAAIGSMLVGLSALLALVVVGWRLWVDFDQIAARGYWIPLLAFAIGGVLLTLLCGIASYSLFAAKLTKRTAIISVTIIVAGMVCGVIGGGGMGLLAERDGGRLMSQDSTKRLSVPAEFKNSTELVINSEQIVQVQYTATTSEPRMELRFSTMMGTSAPVATMTMRGTTAELTISSMECRDRLSLCSLPATIVVFGPALHEITVKNGNVLYTVDDTQPSLLLNLLEATTATVVGDKVITSLTVNAGAHSMMSVENANIHTVNGTFGTGASATFGTIADAALTVPESCAVNQRINLVIDHVADLRVNNSVMNSTKDGTQYLPCASISSEPLQQ